MKTYLVELRETWCYQLAVDAESEEEAHNIAINRWNGSPGEDGHEREEPISVINDGECTDDGDAIVLGDIEDHYQNPAYKDIHHVGNDGLDLN